ncbi:MAG: T9SS type A sorting domain-containing protein [Candidatus Kapaibacterium sp.]
MKKYIFFLALLFVVGTASAQHVGIVRKNYFSSLYDSTLMVNVDVLDSSTIRLGSIDPITGVVTNIGDEEYRSGINLNGATIDPYLNRYYIGSGFNLLTFDINSGSIINNVPITGELPSPSFQNIRFNQSDSTIYGMIPNNFYSSYYDSTVMDSIEVLDSTQIRFASINPVTGQYSIIGTSSFSNLYTLAGNSIDPYQMIYYYSAVDTLIGIDLYTGAQYSAVPISLPPYGIFENIAYSCSDTSIYGMTRQNYVSTVYDSLFMDYIDVIDSTTFRLSKINPATGEVTFLSQENLGAGGNLTGGAFIDPNSRTYFFNNGNQIVGVSLSTGQITSSVAKSFTGGAFAFDMMRSTQNCLNATALRVNAPTGVEEIPTRTVDGMFFPNPAQSNITLTIDAPLSTMKIVDFLGKVLLETSEKTVDISGLSSGLYFANVSTKDGAVFTGKFVKQ